MRVILYVNSGDVRQLNKNLSQIADLSDVEVTEPTDILEPALTFGYDPSYLNVNYVYIPLYKRYYFTGEPVIHGNFITINCNVDVAMSHKNALLNSYIIAERSASRPDAYIPDNCVSDKGTISYSFRKSGVVPFGTSGDNYVLTIAGK